ncbi:MAG: HEAT repeat domain-containing protein [Ignavibacteria bacterium]|nr:HEAT repeat domain-containing protein [Ignavibacteria bacterium]
MKKTSYTAVLAVALSLVLFTGLTAQKKANFPENGIKNLVMAIKSDNDGLKISGIYLSGYYKVEKTIPVLFEAFSHENSKNKILIALSLYQMGKDSCIIKLMELSKEERNFEVKRICNAVVEQYQIDAELASK